MVDIKGECGCVIRAEYGLFSHHNQMSREISLHFIKVCKDHRTTMEIQLLNAVKEAITKYPPGSDE